MSCVLFDELNISIEVRIQARPESLQFKPKAIYREKATYIEH